MIGDEQRRMLCGESELVRIVISKRLANVGRRRHDAQRAWWRSIVPRIRLACVPRLGIGWRCVRIVDHGRMGGSRLPRLWLR